jgi:dipeptidyl aminopeptidase/acylaminoacyl peptidase
MTDERVDALIRRLDVAAMPDPGISPTRLAALLPRVRAARAQDATRLGRVRRDVQMAIAGRVVPFGSSPAQTRLAALLLVGLLIAATLIALIVGSAHRLPPPFGLAANGRIAYVADGHVYTADVNATSARQVTFGPGTESKPTFSPDGTRLAFLRYYPGEPVHDPQLCDIVVAGSDGSNEVVVERAVKGVSNLSWSPDGRSLAYSRATGRIGFDRSWVVDVDGSGRRVDLGSFSDGSWGPTWSPDGQRLALAAEQSLYVVDRDGGNRRKLTQGAYGEVGSKGEAAEWNPDGTLLVFAAGVPAGDHKVYVVGLDGKRERVISGDSNQANGATWSPDGSRIAYMRAGSGTGPLVAITNANGASMKLLPGHYGWFQPSWSPDGTKIIVTDDRPGPNDAFGPAVRVILDVGGAAPPIEIPAPGITPDLLPDWAASWQRLALP